ncbi:MAG: hypothetical protein C0607_16075 [Azoarcus sp.]|nr:MAG: hypothetical protein C0607_16075 [Azoarcus sp.]
MTIFVGTRDQIGEILDVVDSATRKRIAPALDKLGSGKLELFVIGRASVISLGGSQLALIVDDASQGGN